IAGYRLGQVAVGDRVAGRNRQRAQASSCKILGQVGHGLQSAEYPRDVGVDGFRLWSGVQSPACAGKQLHVETALEMLERGTHGWLRHIEQACSRGYGTGPHDGVENFDVSK